MAVKYRIRKGDRVMVMSGREKGKTGEVMRMLPESGRVVVNGVNMVRRHTKPSATNPGGIVDKEAAIAISNVALIDPKDNKPTRIGFRFLEDGRKVRFAKRSGEVIDR